MNAIVLGGTNPHIELINNLKNRGYYTILIDYYENPPAKSAADLHIQESTMDYEKVLEIAQKYQAKLVISACIDQANLTACYVSEKLGLTVPYSFQTALEVTDKGLMKEKMVKIGIQTSRHTYLEENEEVNLKDFRYPLIVKPADNCGSAGVKKVQSEQELSEKLKTAFSASRSRKAIVEEFVTGREVSVYAFVHEGKAKIIMMSERHSMIYGPNEILICYATTTPPKLSEAARRKIDESTDLIAKGFGLDNTALHVQALIDGDQVNIIEFAPRVGGGVSYKTIKEKTGFDIINATVDSFLNIKVFPFTQYNDLYYSINIVYGKPGILSEVVGFESFIEAGLVDAVHNYKPLGSEIKDDKANGARICNFIVSDRSYAGMMEKITKVMEGIDVLDERGLSILNRNIFIQDHTL
jgi:biotin carboxylase